MDIGNALQELRFKKKWKQKDAADKIGITQGALSDIENNRRIMSAKMFAKVCATYDLPPVIVQWMATQEADVPRAKKKAFKTLKPLIDNLINEFLK